MRPARVLLIVVQNQTQRALLNRLLGASPHHLVFAGDGEEAFGRFKEVKPDLVIAHLNAERIDGGLLCRLVRQRLGGADVPFVLLGDGGAEAEGLRRASEVQADLFMTLPTTSAQLLDGLEPLVVGGRPTIDVTAGEAVAIGGAADALTTSTLKTSQPAESAEPEVATSEPAIAAEPVRPEATQTPARAASALAPEASDVDTVVSFQNPFFEGPAGAHVEGLPAASVLDGAAPDPLEELPISLGARPQSTLLTAKSHLIAELPRERTPTGDSGAGAPPVGGSRRGLDESQLGKRLAKRVRSMYRLLETADFYELLGVEAAADYDQVRSAYDELSIEFHPDRFFLLRSGDLKEKIYAIYRKVAEAFETLGDEGKRRAYDARARRSRKAPAPPTADGVTLEAVAQTEAGQRYVELALRAFEHGDLNHARLMLSLARSCEASNPSLESALQVVVRAGRPSL